MEQYSNLNVHGKIKQKNGTNGAGEQGTESNDVVLYPTLTTRVPTPLPAAPTTAEAGKAIVVNSAGNGLEYGEAGKVDAVQINGTAIAGDGTQTKIANIIPGTGLANNGATINHSNSVDAATAGTSSATSGATAAIPYVTYDAQGHITASGTHTHTINNLAASTIASGELASARLPNATSSSKGAVTLVYATGESGVITVPTEGKMEEFVNSSIGTNTAYFKGTYDVESDLGLAETATQTQVITALNAKTSWKVGGAPTNNDYCFVQFDLSQDPGNVDRYDRYKYSAESTPATWVYEYTLNNSSFTSEQWAAINSKISNSTVGTQSVRSVDVKYIVTGPASATVDHIATFNSADGNVVKDSGFTIETSVPANAVFTDEHVTSSANHYSPLTASGQDKTASASGATAAWSIDVVQGVTLNTDGKGHVTGISVASGKIPAQPAHQTITQDGITGATINRYGVCSTAAATAAKAVSITAGTFPTLNAGANGTKITVNFTNANIATSAPTLNVNSKGAKNIYYRGAQVTATTNTVALKGPCDFIYDNSTGWHLVGNNSIEATDVTLADM